MLDLAKMTMKLTQLPIKLCFLPNNYLEGS